MCLMWLAGSLINLIKLFLLFIFLLDFHYSLHPLLLAIMLRIIFLLID